jgi:hypothetical protein
MIDLIALRRLCTGIMAVAGACCCARVALLPSSRSFAPVQSERCEQPGALCCAPWRCGAGCGGEGALAEALGWTPGPIFGPSLLPPQCRCSSSDEALLSARPPQGVYLGPGRTVAVDPTPLEGARPPSAAVQPKAASRILCRAVGMDHARVQMAPWSDAHCPPPGAGR